MNKFSSMSTGVLLALLTSSVFASDFAESDDNLSGHDNPRSISDSTKKAGGKKLADATGIRASGAIAMDRCSHTIDLSLNEAAANPKPAPNPASPSTAPMARSLVDSKNLKPSVFEPQNASKVVVSFDYPHEFNESYIMAGDSTVISYSSEDSNLLITLKLTPMHDLALGYEEFKRNIISRFSDKDKMLYGEYEVLSEVKNTKEALKRAQKDSSMSPVSEDDDYMELSIRAFLKKGEDGIYPDMQNFFYERNIISHNYIATLSCELQGRQSSVSIVKDQFESLSPLCERIINSYSFNFVQ
ncbi:MAG: hypothetical protein Q4A68_06125 [Anaerobiospirillum succiniciproducens]|uniref:hypothetical protein n=1 Tax=Anaerobiospirillum succiniciproducens TaxID=13335 RepID=UPI0026DD49BF|nr:hypothetical protein [Anaerobiospirillum succiniciproducens]MDO4676138.1 hypothetical protein [Anaerobiospirillum succiniciproducens]